MVAAYAFAYGKPAKALTQWLDGSAHTHMQQRPPVMHAGRVAALKNECAAQADGGAVPLSGSCAMLSTMMLMQVLGASVLCATMLSFDGVLPTQLSCTLVLMPHFGYAASQAVPLFIAVPCLAMSI